MASNNYKTKLKGKCSTCTKPFTMNNIYVLALITVTRMGAWFGNKF